MATYREDRGLWHVFPFHGNLLTLDIDFGPTIHIHGEEPHDCEELDPPTWVQGMVTLAEAGDARVED